MSLGSRIVLGTSSIVDEKTHEPLLPVLSLIVDTVVKLKRDGHRVILVSSGAIGVALRMLDLERRPKHLHAVQVRFSIVARQNTANLPTRRWQLSDNAG